MAGKHLWIALCTAIAFASAVAVVVLASNVRRAAWPAHVRALPPAPPPPIIHVGTWPIHDTKCNGDEACLLARYRDMRAMREAMEVGALEASLGEAFAGAGPLLAAISPPAGTAPSVAACNALSRAPVTIHAESLRRPQRDCYFACLDFNADADATTCVRDRGCAKEPVLDGEWRLAIIVPRLACLALLQAPAPPLCAGLPEMVDEQRPPRACNPQQLCAAGGNAVPSTLEPFVLPPNDNCASRPTQWSCAAIVTHFPRAACQYGN
jgi:hypothetical protein